MRAKFIRGKDSKKALNVGISKKIKVMFDFREINTDKDRVWDYIEVFKAILKQIDSNVDITEEKTFTLYESGEPGQHDYGGIIRATIATNLDLSQIEAKLKSNKYENRIEGDEIQLDVTNEEE